MREFDAVVGRDRNTHRGAAVARSQRQAAKADFESDDAVRRCVANADLCVICCGGSWSGCGAGGESIASAAATDGEEQARHKGESKTSFAGRLYAAFLHCKHSKSP